MKNPKPTNTADIKLQVIPLPVPKQQVHYLATASTVENGYQASLDAMIASGKEIVAMQLTREHLIVVTK